LRGGENVSVNLLSPIPGKVLKILVAVGDEVTEDDEVMEIESMKMENPIYAPSSGVVKEIAVKVSDEVEVDDLLMVID
jgi:acetyl-CoA carboxylase biotin carboxyl carrier protein